MLLRFIDAKLYHVPVLCPASYRCSSYSMLFAPSICVDCKISSQSLVFISRLCILLDDFYADQMFERQSLNS